MDAYPWEQRECELERAGVIRFKIFDLAERIQKRVLGLIERQAADFEAEDAFLRACKETILDLRDEIDSFLPTLDDEDPVGHYLRGVMFTHQEELVKMIQGTVTIRRAVEKLPPLGLDN